MSRKTSTHERLDGVVGVKGSSDRSFGIVFAAVFGVIAAWPLLNSGTVRWWSLAISGVFLSLALVRPSLLSPLNRLWLQFGLLLHKVVNPAIMLLLFVTTVVPIGLILRIMGKDLLRLNPAPHAESFWVERTPPGPDPADMPNQF